MGWHGTHTGPNRRGRRTDDLLACRWSGCSVCGAEGDDVTLSPTDARLILACMNVRGSAIRPGDLTGEMRLEIETRLRECADKDGEE